MTHEGGHATLPYAELGYSSVKFSIIYSDRQQQLSNMSSSGHPHPLTL